jgi:hypothetical protein
MKGVFDPSFVKIVDEFIAEIPESDIWNQKLRGWDRAV